ncbi:MAG: S-adenosylmethionine:tRNA ribosyltransferase-isomerase, partial [Prevotella sp.]|nr:S-adenosylmethionine:tRNA ribosyltransferase-isomerase [Prevotella sp.]
SEHISVRRQTIENLIRHGGRAIAVGTTSVRTLESLYYIGRKILLNPQIGEEELAVKQWEPYEIRDSRSEERETRSEERGRGNEEGKTVNSQLSTLNSLRAILDWLDRHQLDTLTSATQIIIVPGYEYKIVSHLVTNFHQPQSTLLLLVSAFVGGDWRRIYNYALDHDFRFLSYGESSLLIPCGLWSVKCGV